LIFSINCKTISLVTRNYSTNFQFPYCVIRKYKYNVIFCAFTQFPTSLLIRSSKSHDSRYWCRIITLCMASNTCLWSDSKNASKKSVIASPCESLQKFKCSCKRNKTCNNKITLVEIQSFATKEIMTRCPNDSISDHIHILQLHYLCGISMNNILLIYMTNGWKLTK